MIINIDGGKERMGKAWSRYVLYGTKRRPRDPDKVHIIDGDTQIGDMICTNSKNTQTYYSIVLAVKGKHDLETMKKMYTDWKRNFFVGLGEEEYHVDAVLHDDTDDSHIHVRVPTTHLTKDKHLQLYYDKKDRGRMTAIQDYISLKYGFEIAREVGKQLKEEEKLEDIEVQLAKWRTAEGREPIKLEKARDKKHIERQINRYILTLEAEGVLKSQEQITEKLEELGFTVERYGTDFEKEFSYVTVSNETGKMRIKGDYYSDEYWKNHQEMQQDQQIKNARRTRSTKDEEVRFKKVTTRLNSLNEKRFQECKRLFGNDGVRKAEYVEQITHTEVKDQRHKRNMKKVGSFLQATKQIKDAAGNPIDQLRQTINQFNNFNAHDQSMEVSSIGLLGQLGKMFEHEDSTEGNNKELEKINSKREKQEELEMAKDEEEQVQEQTELEKQTIRRQR